MPLRMNWMGREGTAKVRQKLARNLHAADMVLIDQCRDMIGIQGPPRSKPGDPPHIDSSALIDSLFDEVDASDLQSRIGSTEEHAVYTEEGTKDDGGNVIMEPRPWFAPSIELAADDMGRELGK